MSFFVTVSLKSQISSKVSSKIFGLNFVQKILKFRSTAEQDVSNLQKIDT